MDQSTDNNDEHANDTSHNHESNNAMFHLISACDDSQTAADVSDINSQFSLPNSQGKSGGACTAALLNALYAAHENGTIDSMSWVGLLKEMRKDLIKKEYDQIPQLTSSHRIEVDKPFKIVNDSPDSMSGTKRAIMIGINYVGQQGELSGCHTDVKNMRKYLVEVYGFKKSDIIVLMDDGIHHNPTKHNIMKAYRKIVRDSLPGDTVFLHFSGHGGRQVDLNGDEDDGYDETLIPVDFQEAGQIVDDDLWVELVKAMPQRVLVTSLMDCCHSGTVLDLPYQYAADEDNVVSSGDCSDNSTGSLQDDQSPETPETAAASSTVSEDARLYELITSKNWKRAEEFLDDKSTFNKEEKLENLQYQDSNGYTPLVKAVLKKSAPVSLIKTMINLGKRETLEVTNDSDWNVLHWAAYSNNVSLEVFKLILEKSNRDVIYAKNNYDKTPLEILLNRNKAAFIDKTLALLVKEQLLSDQKTTVDRLCTSWSTIKTLAWAHHLPESEKDIVLERPLFKAILNSTFICPRYIFISMMDLYMQIALVLVFSFFLRNAIIQSDTSPFLSLIILVVCFVWFLIREMTELMLTYLKNYFLEPTNVLDIIQFVLLAGSIVIIFASGIDDDLNPLSTIDHAVFISATCVAWLKLLFVVGNLYYNGAVFANGVITIIGKIVPFLFTSAVLLLMFSHMYLMWGAGHYYFCSQFFKSDDEWTCNLPSSYHETFSMFLGLNSEVQVSTFAISYVYGFFISILMMNILIAIICYSYAKVLESGDRTFWRNRLKFIAECQCFFNMFCCAERHNRIRNESTRYGRIDSEIITNFDLNVDQDGDPQQDNGPQVHILKNDRISFGTHDWSIYNKKIGANDKREFFGWWFETSVTSTPSLRIRLKYFFSRALWEDIICPGQEFENILLGIQYNKSGRGLRLFFVRLVCYVLIPFSLLIIILMFCFGSVSFGLLWHRKMREHLFAEDTNKFKSEQVEARDTLKEEIFIELQEYETNINDSLEQLVRKHEEKIGKQFAILSKKQKMNFKKQNEHEYRFDVIDEHLSDIKKMLSEMGNK